MSQEDPDNPLVVGLHIPKCAGLTVLRHVQRHMQNDLIFQCTAIFDNYDCDRPELMNIRRKDRLKFVFGHHFHEGMLALIRQPTLFFTGLREPLDRMNSDLGYNERLYNYLGKTFDVDSYIRRIRNPICNFLVHRFPSVAGSNGSLVERAMHVLEYFDFIYFPETFSELCAKVTKILSLPPITKDENVAPSSNVYDIDATNFSEDIALYKEAYQRWGPGSSVRGSVKAAENIMTLRHKSHNLDVLRKFYYRVTYEEYKNWNVLEQVIDARKALISELNAELELYARFESTGTKEKKPPEVSA